MRLLALALLLGCTCVVAAQSKLNLRYDIDYDGITFPQVTPKQGLAAVIKAIDDKRVEYLLAHLADPEFVDKRVQEVHRGKFNDMVKEVTAKFVNDPDTIKLLRRFAQDGEWEGGDTTASAKLMDVKDRVFFRRLEGRWFLEDRKMAAKDDKAEK